MRAMFTGRSFPYWLALLALNASGCPANNSTTGGGAGTAGAPTSTSASTTSASTASASSTSKPRRIILLTNGNSPFWDAARVGMQDAEKELDLKSAGLAAVLDVNDGTPEGQLDKLRQIASQSDVAAVGVSAIDRDNVAIADELRKLRKKGVHVITVDSDFAPDLADARFAYLGSNNLEAGQVLGVAARHLLPDGGEYVTFVGRTGAQNAIERVGGLAEGAGEKFTSKDNMGDDIDPIRARENVRNAIGNHKQLKMLVGIWSYNAPAIVDVVKERKVRDRFTLVAFDAEPLAIEAMEQGYLDALVVQNPYNMGFDGVRLMKALVKDDKQTLQEMLPGQKEKGGDFFDTRLKVVVPDKGSPLKAEHFGKRAEFFHLGEFRKWLNSHGLIGS